MADEIESTEEQSQSMAIYSARDFSQAGEMRVVRVWCGSAGSPQSGHNRIDEEHSTGKSVVVPWISTNHHRACLTIGAPIATHGSQSPPQSPVLAATRLHSVYLASHSVYSWARDEAAPRRDLRTASHSTDLRPLPLAVLALTC